MKNFEQLRILYILVKKDLQLYFVKSGFLLLSIVLSLAYLIIFRFSQINDASNTSDIITILWASHFLAVMFSLYVSQQWEWQNSSYRLQKLAGIDGSLVFIAKSLAMFVAISALWLMEFFFWYLFYAEAHQGSESVLLWQMLLLGLPVNLSLSFCGILVAAIAVHGYYKNLLLIILMTPLSLPVIISSGSLSQSLWQGVAMLDNMSHLNIIISFILLFLGLGIALYNFLLEE